METKGVSNLQFSGKANKLGVSLDRSCKRMDWHKPVQFQHTCLNNVLSLAVQFLIGSLIYQIPDVYPQNFYFSRALSQEVSNPWLRVLTVLRHHGACAAVFDTDSKANNTMDWGFRVWLAQSKLKQENFEVILLKVGLERV